MTDRDFAPGQDGTDQEVRRSHAAAGEPRGRRSQLDGAGGGYGSSSGDASSGGTGDGAPGDGEMDDGTTSGGTGAAAEGPTEWLRSAD